MKKFLAIILAAVLVLSLGVTAFAANDPDPNEIPEVTNPMDATINQYFYFNKLYVDEKGDPVEDGMQPVETLKFDYPVKGNEVANAPQLSIEDVSTTNNPQRVKVTVKPAKNVTLGKYNYLIKETPGVTAGVEYNTVGINVQVMISKDDEGKFVETVTFTDSKKGSKLTAIENTFKTNKNDDDALSVDKNVTGTMCDVNAVFTIHLTLTSVEKPVLSPIEVGGVKVGAGEWSKEAPYTYTHKLEMSDGSEVVSITNVPDGVTYTIEEDKDHIRQPGDNADYSNEPTKGYDVEYKINGSVVPKAETGATVARGTIKVNQPNAVVITNDKDGEVDTGINLDVLPYVIILAVAALGTVLFVTKRRVRE